MAFVKTYSSFNIGDIVETTRKIGNFYGYFEEGTVVKIVDITERGYTLEDENLNRVSETGFDSVRHIDTNNNSLYLNNNQIKKDKISYTKVLTRTAAENTRFIEYIESAIDKAEQAIGNISYSSSYYYVNKSTIEKIQKAIDILNDTLDTDIHKPF